MSKRASNTANGAVQGSSKRPRAQKEGSGSAAGGQEVAAASSSVADTGANSASSAGDSSTKSSDKSKRVVHEAKAADAASGNKRPYVVLPRGVKLVPGDRIEVQWDVESPESSHLGSVAIWWGATYNGQCGDDEIVGESSPHAKHILIYDARAGYPQTESEVAFLSMSRLLDCQEQDTLMWRVEGQDWVCDPNDNNVGPLLEEPPIVMTMQDLLHDQTRLDQTEHSGVSVETLGMAALGRLPYLAQTNIASNFRNFADSIKEKLADIRRERGAGATVTSRDIKEIMEQIDGKSN